MATTTTTTTSAVIRGRSQGGKKTQDDLLRRGWDEYGRFGGGWCGVRRACPKVVAFVKGCAASVVRMYYINNIRTHGDLKFRYRSVCVSVARRALIKRRIFIVYGTRRWKAPPTRTNISGGNRLAAGWWSGPRGWKGYGTWYCRTTTTTTSGRGRKRKNRRDGCTARTPLTRRRRRRWPTTVRPWVRSSSTAQSPATTITWSACYGGCTSQRACRTPAGNRCRPRRSATTRPAAVGDRLWSRPVRFRRRTSSTINKWSSTPPAAGRQSPQETVRKINTKPNYTSTCRPYVPPVTSMVKSSTTVVYEQYQVIYIVQYCLFNLFVFVFLFFFGKKRITKKLSLLNSYKILNSY